MRRDLASVRALVDGATLSDAARAQLKTCHAALREWARINPEMGMLALTILLLEMQVEWDPVRGYVSPGERDQLQAEPPPPFVGSEHC